MLVRVRELCCDFGNEFGLKDDYEFAYIGNMCLCKSLRDLAFRYGVCSVSLLIDNVISEAFDYGMGEVAKVVIESKSYGWFDELFQNLCIHWAVTSPWCEEGLSRGCLEWLEGKLIRDGDFGFDGCEYVYREESK